MKEIVEIDLDRPFDRILAAVLGLPSGGSDSDNRITDAELKALLRHIYEAAHGRQGESNMGFIPLEPPVAPFLKATPFNVASKTDFLVAVTSRIISGPNHLSEQGAARRKPPCSLSTPKTVRP